jgi:hypothetical protein
MKVKDAMHQRGRLSQPGTPVTEFAKLMRDHDVEKINQRKLPNVGVR